jgi:hypothetical protein
VQFVEDAVWRRAWDGDMWCKWSIRRERIGSEAKRMKEAMGRIQRDEYEGESEVMGWAMREEMTLFGNRVDDDVDNTWYLYIPGLVGAGTALLAIRWTFNNIGNLP